MPDIEDMLKQLQRLIGTKKMNNWEESFIESCWETSKQGTLMIHLSDPQTENIEKIFNKYPPG